MLLTAYLITAGVHFIALYTTIYIFVPSIGVADALPQGYDHITFFFDVFFQSLYWPKIWQNRLIPEMVFMATSLFLKKYLWTQIHNPGR